MGSVLIIEDDGDFRDNIAHLIRRKGYQVITANDGEDAFATLMMRPTPSLILLDLMMPMMDGWMFRARIMAEPLLASIPIVVMSGVDNVEKESQKLRVADYVGKPVDLEKLYRLLERHVS